MARSKANDTKVSKHLQTDSDILEVLSGTGPSKKMTKQAIFDALEKKDHGVNYKTVLSHVASLEAAGMVSDDGGVYISSDLSRGEAQFLADAVVCSKFIPTRDALALIKRVYDMAGVEYSEKAEREKLKKRSHIENEEFFRSIDVLLTAIESNCKVQFNYHKFLESQKLSTSSNVHVFNPYQFVMKNQHYYVVGFDEGIGKMTALRVIKMKSVKIYEEENVAEGKKRIPKRIKESSVPGYEKSGIDIEKLTANPYMYMDPAESFVIKIREDAITDVIDWFGIIAKARQQKTEDGFVLYQVKASRKAMLYWALQYVDVAEVIHPESFRTEIRSELSRGLRKYK